MIFTINEIQYAGDDNEPPLYVYLYGDDGMHSGRILVETAEDFAKMLRWSIYYAMKSGREVRVTNMGDEMVLHIANGRVLYPTA